MHIFNENSFHSGGGDGIGIVTRFAEMKIQKAPQIKYEITTLW